MTRCEVVHFLTRCGDARHGGQRVQRDRPVQQCGGVRIALFLRGVFGRADLVGVPGAGFERELRRYPPRVPRRHMGAAERRHPDDDGGDDPADPALEQHADVIGAGGGDDDGIFHISPSVAVVHPPDCTGPGPAGVSRRR